MAVESYGDAMLSAAREKSFPSEMPWALADALRDVSSRTDTDSDESVTMAGFYACAACAA